VREIERERKKERKKEKKSENSITGFGVWRTIQRGYNRQPRNPHTGFTSACCGSKFTL